MGGAHENADHRQEFSGRLREWAKQQGEPVGLQAAEAFKVIRP